MPMLRSAAQAPMANALLRHIRTLSRSIVAAMATYLAMVAAPALADEPAEGLPSSPPLHQQIDALVAEAAVGPLVPVCDDADFLRRLYLDLSGVIPTLEQVKAFLADDSPAKRADLIDVLLDSPEFARHMAVQWNVLLLDRRSDKYVDQTAWEAYLIDSIVQHKPLDQMFRELVDPDGLGEETTAARKFLLNRDAEPHAMTRDIGRLVFGMDMQCAQCHDHPLIGDYYQEDYYGLYAFLHRTSLFEDPANKQGKLAERADGEAPFESVFSGEGRSATRPRLPKGSTLYVEPTLSEEEAYRIKPEKTQAAKPTFSRRQALAERLAESTQVRRNLANRVWALFMGRGLVHPSDFHYAANPPTNPALLSLLANALADNGFDLRYVVRELVLSKTYQRSCEPPSPDVLNFADIRSRQDALTLQSEIVRAEVTDLKAAATDAEKSWREALAVNDQVAAELPELEAKWAQSRQAVEQTGVAEQMAIQALDTMRVRSQQIENVIGATRTAVKQAADEPALSEALAILEKRAGQLESSLQKAQSELESQTAAAKQARQAAAKLESQVAELAARQIQPDQLVQHEQTHLLAATRLADADGSRRLLDAQIALCEMLGDYQTRAVDDPQKATAVWELIVQEWTVRGQIAPLKPLTPEQLAASAMQATGFFIRTQAAAKAAVEKAAEKAAAEKTKAEKDKAEKAAPEKTKAEKVAAEKPSGKQRQADALAAEEQMRLRDVTIQTEMINQLRGNVNQFVAQYGGLAGEEFQATVNQALFLGNSPVINGWLAVSGESLIGRLSNVDSMPELADELTLAVFSRPATRDEHQEIADFLSLSADDSPADRTVALAELVWALISSAEFRFNH